MEAELALVKEAELVAIQAQKDSSDKYQAEIIQLESELASAREAESVARQDTLERDKSEVEKLEKELETLREERRRTQRENEILAEIWKPLCSLAAESVPEEVPDPPDLSLILDALQTVETQLTQLREECSEKSERCVQLTQTIETVQEQLEKKNSRAGRGCSQDPTAGAAGSNDIRPKRENSQEEEATLVAEDTSVLSISADAESSPELIGHQSESPEESKGTSSDEMVTSSDSEVVHNSWTLLEAVNQGGQEWPSVPQDFGQSWVTTSMEQEVSTVQSESSSVVIGETVEVHLTQQSSSSDVTTSSGVFAHALAEELQKRCSELLEEVQRFKDAAVESQEKIWSLKEETQFLAVAREEAEAQARDSARELESAREEVKNRAQQNSSMVEKHGAEAQLQQEQIDALNGEVVCKEQKIRTLLQTLSEQKSEARMLSAQLEDREMLYSELERKFQDMENSMLEFSNESMSKKDSEISELHLRLSQREEEVRELNDSMSTKLLQAEEEKFQIKSEVGKLREQILELEKVRDDTKAATPEPADHPDEELVSLRKEKEELESQLTTTKKKLQAALVQRKELMKKVGEFEKEAHERREKSKTSPEDEPQSEKSKEHDTQDVEAQLVELKEALRSKEEVVQKLEEKINLQDQVLSETLALNEKLKQEAENSQQAEKSPEASALSQVSSLEAEIEALQKKLHEAQESRKETIRKAKEKDRHHREQMKQQKEEYGELTDRYEVQSGEKEALLEKLAELEIKMSSERENVRQEELKIGTERSAVNDWVQEDWVDFVSSEAGSSQPQSSGPGLHPSAPPGDHSAQIEESPNALREEIEIVRQANTKLEQQLHETRASLSLKEAQLLEKVNELQALREKEKQIYTLSEEINNLREKYHQAESYAETLRSEMEAAAKTSSESSITALQAEVEDFRQFLDDKNREIQELSQQLSEQSSLIRSMHDTVSQKDQLIASLQEELKAEQEKTQKLEAESPRKQEGDNEAKVQQLQRKLQAALVSRKDALKENKSLKDQLASAEKAVDELQQKVDSAEEELENLKTERARLIEEVDQTLLENQSLGSSCESLKLAMEGIISEKDACKREVELAKEEAAKVCAEWEEKVKGMKEEYETLLKSYENVSDEAERVRKVLEAARQERQELAAKVRSHEAVRHEAERQAEDAQKEVESVKDKMRKFAKTKQQKILELEEENERLREEQEKSVTKRDNVALKAEAEQLQDEAGALKAELEAMKAERDSLVQQIEDLKEQLTHTVERNQEMSESPLNHAAVIEEVVAVQRSDTVMTTTERVERKETQENQIVAATETHSQHPEADRTDNDQTLVETREIGAEKELWHKREAELQAELASLKQDLQETKERESLFEKCLLECKEREKGLSEDSSKRETQFKELLASLESEKDNLEERLMNQLAQLNGSIASYQQEAADNREQLTEVQREVERLERERAELEAEARSETDRAARLEEDVRQARRERAEAVAESGKQRELEQQLRSAQRVKEGSQSRTRQLEELLREKQLEVRQLQKDCIRYQERISELGKEAKALQLGQEELRRKLEQTQQEHSKTSHDLKQAEEEMVGCKAQLAEAHKQVQEVSAAKMAIEQSLQQREATLKAEAEQTLDSVRFRLGAELKEMELRLEEADAEREKEEEATLEARQMAETAEKRAQEMKARLDESLARLAAFSRSMSSLQDDRDRVLDEARQWESRFNSTLQGKEAEVREAETRARELADQLQKESALKEELQFLVNGLQKADEDWQLRLQEKEKKATENQAALEQERMKLDQTTAELLSAQSEARSLKTEAESRLQRVRALEEAVGRLQGEVDQARAELREREAEERRLCLNVEQLETDLRSSKVLTENLQTELHEKEKREVELLGEIEHAVAQATEEARKEADSRTQGAEEELKQRRGEVCDLGEKLRKAEEEGNNRKTKLDSFTKAMGSLQDDRDRVLNMYKQLEEKHIQVILEKDGLIQEAAGENNSLKGELRALLVQRDDLYAEKAKLSAQLHGYRDELNHVLSMKDSQHKRLLAAERERIASLEKEHEELESRLKSLSRARQEEVGQRVENESLSRASNVGSASQATDAPGAEVEKLREQLQKERAEKEALEELLNRERHEQESKSKELAELRWEGGVMRTESESAQERVAELARDLLTVEQRLLQETETTKHLRAENLSFSKAMASLQDSRDQALHKVRELSLKLETSQAGGQAAHSSPGGSAGEVWGLKNALQALQNDRERLLEQFETQTAELKKHKSELARLGAGELIKVSKELFEEKTKNEDLLGVLTQLENEVETGKREVETLRLEQVDWMAQAEQLKQQTLATLTEKDQQLWQLTSMLEEARAQKPKLQPERLQREGTEELDGAPGAPQERGSFAYVAEVKELQQRLEEETQQRLVVEEQLMATQDRLKRHSQTTWHSAHEGDSSETAVFIEPPEGAVTRTRRGGPSLMRMLRVAFCSRQRTPLLLSLYLLTVHVLLLLCLGGYL
uniref:Golgi autoantigen, golgin subfamily b, macrogolgin (With transmembrane signal), 1 n=1 Tax=Nothobranchius korthausae TaxID=1143690 RepID=A0A1A8GAG6_9TELE